MSPLGRRATAVVVAALVLVAGVSVSVAVPEPASAATGEISQAHTWLYPDDVVDQRASVNGCGSQGDDGVDVPDDWFGVSFTESCDWHDRCYGTKGLSQAYCDRGMLHRTKDACGSNWPCSRMADVYYLGVSMFGGDPYREGQQAACDRDPGRDGRVHGDPHLQTLDGRNYSLMAAGEFALLRDADGSDLIQARFHPRTDDFTIVSGVAVRLGEREVVVDLDPDTDDLTIHVDGERVTRDMAAFDEGLVEMGGALVGTRRVVSIRGWDGLLVEALVYPGRLDLSVHLPEAYWGEVSGLLGDADGDPENDLVDRRGRIVPMDATSVEINGDDDVKEAFRIDPDDSMFTPDPDGFDYHADDIGKYPLTPDPLARFDEADIAAARELCESVGLEGAGLEACAFDVLVSGDEAYAQQSARSAARARYISHPHGNGDGHHAGDGDLVLVPLPPLVAAVEANDLDAVRGLLDAGEDIDVGRESDGLTPLLASLVMGHEEITVLLLDRGANPNAFGPDQTGPLQFAVLTGQPIELVGRLLAAGADPDTGSDGDAFMGPLALAAAAGRVDVIELLLEFGADVDGGRGGGGVITPLYLAAAQPDLDVARVLLANGANPNGRYPRVHPAGPLQAAVIAGNADMVRLLLQAGADPRSAAPPGGSLQFLTDDQEILDLLGS